LLSPFALAPTPFALPHSPVKDCNPQARLMLILRIQKGAEALPNEFLRPVPQGGERVHALEDVVNCSITSGIMSEVIPPMKTPMRQTRNNSRMAVSTSSSAR